MSIPLSHSLIIHQPIEHRKFERAGAEAENVKRNREASSSQHWEKTTPTTISQRNWAPRMSSTLFWMQPSTITAIYSYAHRHYPVLILSRCRLHTFSNWIQQWCHTRWRQPTRPHQVICDKIGVVLLGANRKWKYEDDTIKWLRTHIVGRYNASLSQFTRLFMSRCFNGDFEPEQLNTHLSFYTKTIYSQLDP